MLLFIIFLRVGGLGLFVYYDEEKFKVWDLLVVVSFSMIVVIFWED